MCHETPHPPDPTPTHPARHADGGAPAPRSTERIALELLCGVHAQVMDMLGRDPDGAPDEAWARAGELLADESIHACAEVLRARAHRHQMDTLRPLAEQAVRDGFSLADMAARVLRMPA
jgi:hypothetical protein